DLFESVTTPPTRDPAGSTVCPPTTTGCARCAVTRSSTRLVSEPTAVSSTTGSVVPAGIVTSRIASLVGGAAEAGGRAVPAAASARVAAAAVVSARLQPTAASATTSTPILERRIHPSARHRRRPAAFFSPGGVQISRQPVEVSNIAAKLSLHLPRPGAQNVKMTWFAERDARGAE